MIEIKSLSRTYKRGTHFIHALRNIDLTIEEGQFISFIGKSGSGKSTLLNILGGLDTPSGGEIFYRQKPISGFNSSQLAEYRKTSVGIIFQSFNLIYTQTALANVSTALAIGNVPRRKRKGTALELLENVGLSDRAMHLPGELSGGESQRVAIARALANNPEIILADEPTGNLDSDTSGKIIGILQKLNREQKKTLIMVTHDAEIAHRISDKVITLKDGEIQKIDNSL